MKFDPPAGWATVPLAQVATVVMGNSPPGETYNSLGEGVPLLNGPTEFGSVYPTAATWTLAPTRYALAGDILFCVRGSTTGRMNRADQPYCVGRGIAAIRGATEADTDFIFAAIKTRLSRLLAQVTGSTFPSLSRNQLAELIIPWPPPHERRAIRKVVGVLEDKIGSNHRLAELLEKAAGTLFRAHFVDFVGVDEFEKSEIGEIPSGWRVGSVYEHAEVTYGRPFRSSLFNPIEGTPLIRIRDLPTNKPSVLTPELRSDARMVRRGDIVVGMDGEFRAYAWAGPDAWLNQRVCVFDPRDGVSRAFLLHVIKRPLAFFEATKGGTTVIHLGKRDIDAFRVPIPPAEVMREFGLIADPLIAFAVKLRWESRILGSIRDALLPKLISGQIRVPTTAADSAEVIEPAAEAVAAAS